MSLRGVDWSRFMHSVPHLQTHCPSHHFTDRSRSQWLVWSATSGWRGLVSKALPAKSHAFCSSGGSRVSGTWFDLLMRMNSGILNVSILATHAQQVEGSLSCDSFVGQSNLNVPL